MSPVVYRSTQNRDSKQAAIQLPEVQGGGDGHKSVEGGDQELPGMLSLLRARSSLSRSSAALASSHTVKAAVKHEVHSSAEVTRAACVSSVALRAVAAGVYR